MKHCYLPTKCVHNSQIFNECQTQSAKVSTDMKMGLPRQLERHLTTYTRVSSWPPFTVEKAYLGLSQSSVKGS